MTTKKESQARRKGAADRATEPAGSREALPELPAPSPAAARADSGQPGGGQGRVDLTGRMPEDIRIDPDINEGHPGYDESGSSAIEVPITGNGGADMTQRNKTRDGNGTGAPTQPTEEHGKHNALAGHEQSTQMQRRRNDHPLRRLHNEIDSLWEQFFGGGLGLAEWGGFRRPWGMDVDEHDKEIRVRAEAPGFEPKDFDIQINGNMLTIRAEHRQENEQNEGGVRTWQRHYGQFQRSVPLSGPVDADKVEAHYRNGVLELRLPRTEEAERKRIEVKA